MATVIATTSSTTIAITESIATMIAIEIGATIAANGGNTMLVTTGRLDGTVDANVAGTTRMCRQDRRKTIPTSIRRTSGRQC